MHGDPAARDADPPARDGLLNVDPIAIGEALVDLGGWTAFVIGAVAFAFAIIRGWLVPGFVYKREVARADTATTQAERNADAIEDLTDVLANRPVRRRRERVQAG